MYIDLVSHNPFPELNLPLPAMLDSHSDAIQTVYHYIGKYAQRINRLDEEKGYDARQRFLFMLIQLVFAWREIGLSMESLEREIPELISWAEER